MVIKHLVPVIVSFSQVTQANTYLMCGLTTYDHIARSLYIYHYSVTKMVIIKNYAASRWIIGLVFLLLLCL